MVISSMAFFNPLLVSLSLSLCLYECYFFHHPRIKRQFTFSHLLSCSVRSFAPSNSIQRTYIYVCISTSVLSDAHATTLLWSVYCKKSTSNKIELERTRTHAHTQTTSSRRRRRSSTNQPTNQCAMHIHYTVIFHDFQFTKLDMQIYLFIYIDEWISK